ncbi:TVP38/TMEM64 family protein [Anaerocolumna sp. MB42-C2]|uniref:TVP38/TMEM64 family protein n=1 Tax=Anaerocolumna sp. MB42-C2 TaxID=3070997 RepID=UPI0027E07145|nr:VTT domain-containing protein [Anaerocolumna sp. MB42-C2]WMJ87679.1 VTT domain-containing protein [Anaerocolumna sp. MB42-C2]
MNKNKKSINKLTIIILIFFLLMFVLGLISLPYLNLLSEPKSQQTLKAWVTSFGIGGWFLILSMQIIQILIAFIPGEPIEILAGVLYGGFGGLFLCLFGCTLASSCVFMLSKNFGTPLVAKLFNKNKLEAFAFVKDTKKLEIIVFILFIIPGTPKDMLTYVAGTSPMKLAQFLAISTFARFPSIVSSTFIGSTLRNGQWETAALIFALTAILGVLGIKYQEHMVGFCKRLGQRIVGSGQKDENS